MICCIPDSKIGLRRRHSATGSQKRSPMVREITVAFADINGFTRFTEEHGDVAALRMATHLEGVAASSLVGRTRLIKRVGDAVMLAAPSPDDIVATALTLRSVLDADSAYPRLTIGIHHGSAVIADGDIVGGAANVAAHLAEDAATGEIWCTEPVAHGLNGMAGTVAVERGSDRLGGINDISLYELVVV